MFRQIITDKTPGNQVVASPDTDVNEDKVHVSAPASAPIISGADIATESMSGDSVQVNGIDPLYAELPEFKQYYDLETGVIRFISASDDVEFKELNEAKKSAMHTDGFFEHQIDMAALQNEIITPTLTFTDSSLLKLPNLTLTAGSFNLTAVMNDLRNLEWMVSFEKPIETLVPADIHQPNQEMKLNAVRQKVFGLDDALFNKEYESSFMKEIAKEMADSFHSQSGAYSTASSTAPSTPCPEFKTASMQVSVTKTMGTLFSQSGSELNAVNNSGALIVQPDLALTHVEESPKPIISSPRAGFN